MVCSHNSSIELANDDRRLSRSKAATRLRSGCERGDNACVQECAAGSPSGKSAFSTATIAITSRRPEPVLALNAPPGLLETLLPGKDTACVLVASLGLRKCYRYLRSSTAPFFVEDSGSYSLFVRAETAMSRSNPSSDRHGQGWQPDLDSGIAGLSMATSKKQMVPEQGTSAQGSASKARPSVPQKKSHVEELVRLRKELEELMGARDQAYAERDAMADDLLKRIEDDEEKDQQLKKLSREVWDLRDRAERSTKSTADGKRSIVPSRLSFENGKAVSPPTKNGHAEVEAELAQAQRQLQDVTDALVSSEAALAQSNASLAAQSRTSDLNSKLKTDLAQAQQQVMEVTAALRDSETALADSKASLETQSSSRDADVRTATELAQVRQQVHVLTMALVDEKAAHTHSKASLQAQSLSSVPSEVDKQALTEEAQRQSQQKLNEVETHWRSQLEEQKKLREVAESDLRSVRESHETEIKEAQRKYKQQKRRLEKAECDLQDHSQRMDIDSGNTEELGRLRTLASEREGIIKDEQRRAEQFRRMSERLTSQVKQSNLAQRNAEQLEQAAKRQLESMKSQAHASQFRQRGAHMPGGFQ